MKITYFDDAGAISFWKGSWEADYNEDTLILTGTEQDYIAGYNVLIAEYFDIVNSYCFFAHKLKLNY